MRIRPLEAASGCTIRVTARLPWNGATIPIGPGSTWILAPDARRSPIPILPALRRWQSLRAWWLRWNDDTARSCASTAQHGRNQGIDVRDVHDVCHDHGFSRTHYSRDHQDVSAELDRGRHISVR